jgi:hypothetical protein
VGLDVYLVPVGPTRYDLYSEAEHEEAPAAGAPAPASWWQRKLQQFRAMLAEAEQERRRRDRGEPSAGGGLWRAIMRRIAETVAEQRLLWRLRGETVARLVHPLEFDGPGALKQARAQLAADLGKHRGRCVMHAGLAALFGPLLFFVPGPNVVGLYFFFLAIGHYLALRGASQGLTRVTWETEASAPLSGIVAAMGLPRADRRARLDEISAAVGLEHLTGFVERVAARRT